MKSSFALLVLFCVIIFPGVSKNFETSLAGGKALKCSGNLSPKICTAQVGAQTKNCEESVNEFDFSLPKLYMPAVAVVNPDDCSNYFYLNDPAVPCTAREEEKRSNNCEVPQ